MLRQRTNGIQQPHSIVAHAAAARRHLCSLLETWHEAAESDYANSKHHLTLGNIRPGTHMLTLPGLTTR